MADTPEIITKVGGVWAGDELQHTFQREVADLLQRRHHGFPGAQPVSFAARHIEELRREDYYVCEKTDGMRFLMYLTKDQREDGTLQDIHYLVDRKNNYYFIPHLHFPHHEDKTFERFHSETILDGELVEDIFPDQPSVIKFLVFDCLVLDNNSLMHRSLDKRLAYFKLHVLEPYKAMVRQFPQGERPFLVEDKSTEFSYGLEKMFKEIIPKVKKLHGNDGLIFTCRNTPYKSGTDEHILKWKPPEENTIDFLMHITWSLLEADPGDQDQTQQEDYLSFPERFDLYVYHGDTDYRLEAPLYVTRDEWDSMRALGKPLQDVIIECYLEPFPGTNGHAPNGNEHSNSSQNGRWRFHRLREDKLDGNHISTVRSVMESIQDHVTETDLLRAADSIRSSWKAREAAKKRG